MIVSLFALLLPSFVLAEDVADNCDQITGICIYSPEKRQEILELLDNTLVKMKENDERYNKLLGEIEKQQDRKKITAKAFFAIYPLWIPIAVQETQRIKHGRDDKYHYQSVERRRIRYEEAKNKFAEKPTRTTSDRAKRIEKKYISSLTKYFLDDPASALIPFIEEDKGIFLDIAEKDPSSVTLLSNFNKVISAPPEMYSEYALKRLSSVSTRKFYKRLAEYIEVNSIIKSGMPDAVKDIKNSRVKRVIKKEIKEIETQINIPDSI
jgi:uncharacterized circularly permuted ATP-grasp superfamily protein